jgi:hypothetical protein
MSASTALRLSGRDALALLHRTTSNALADLLPGQARATLFCDFRGRLLQRAVVARTSDGAIWLLRPDAPGAELAAAVERTVFRDDVRIEDRSDELAVVLARALPGLAPGVEERDGTPHSVFTGDGTSLVLGGTEPLGEAARIALLHPRHGHEIVEAYNPFEVGLAHEVHLAKGCFTGQEALQRLITYESVRRRPVHVRLGGGAPPASPLAVPVDVIAHGQPVGALTSVCGGDGLVVVRREAIEQSDPLTLADGTPLVVVSAPEPARPLGRA